MLRVSDCAGLVDDSRVAPSPVLPSASSNDVGALNGLISQLNTGPTCAPAELLHHTSFGAQFWRAWRCNLTHGLAERNKSAFLMPGRPILQRARQDSNLRPPV